MKKSILVFALLLSLNAFSQYKLDKGDAQLNAGVGVSQWGLPAYVGVDVGIHKFISVGGEVSFRSYFDGYGRDRQSIIGLTGNGNFHFSGLIRWPEDIDIYMGLNAGFYYRSNTSGVTSGGYGGVGAQVGGRYYFTDNFGVNAEIGGSTMFDWAKVGITYIF